MKRVSEHSGEVVFVDHTAAMGGAECYLLDVVTNYPDPCRVVLFEDGKFAELLRDAGAKVTVLRAPASLGRVRRDAGIGPAVRAALDVYAFSRRLAKELNGAKAVFLNSQKALVCGALAARKAGIPAIWSLHDIVTSDHFGAINRRAAVFLANRYVTSVIVNSVATRESLVDAGYRGSSAAIVHNGIATEGFDSVPKDARAAVREELGIRNDALVIGLFGRIAEWKGQIVLVEALRELPDAVGLFVGAALFPDDERYEAQIRSAAQSYGVEERTMFAGFRSDVPRVMTACDIVAHTSVAPEPFGRVIVEAMLAEVPVVAANAGGAAEIIQDGVTGRLVTPGSPSLLASAISGYTDDQTQRDAIVSNAREHAASEYSIERMVDGVRRAIGKAINSYS